MLRRRQADRSFSLPPCHALRPMNTEDRGVDALWPTLVEAARARGPRDLSAVPLAALTWAEGRGWQLQGPWDAPAQALFALFKPLLDLGSAGSAWSIAQLGQSLDGFVATRTGDSSFINGPENLLHLHRLRALCDAVIVGGGTVAADNPRLTTRRVPGAHPTRVLLDPQLRLAACVETAHVFTDGQAPTLWLCDARWRDAAVARVGADRVLAVNGLLRDGHTLHLPHAVVALHARGLTRLFVEGGGVTVSRFLAQQCLDRLHLAVAPILIGDGRPGLRFAGPARLAECQRPPSKVYPMGPDHVWDLDLCTWPSAGVATMST
jgi:diaminohydroxyphosphoribosylaminopyrimidine deaminase / 5-amino-6-(5-phosphoribosylamino)uracil reductase